MAEAPRVALLARPGEACERLRSALREAGGEIVIEADPSTIDPQALRIAAVETVLVALDPAVEDALEKFDEVLADRAIEVIFDEADLAARREGWDAARWVRHLAAKLHRHDDVLPPGREPDEALVDAPDEIEVIAQDMPVVAEFDAPAFEAPALEMPALDMAVIDAPAIETFDAEALEIAMPAFDEAEFVVEPVREVEAVHEVEAAAPVATAYAGISFTDDINDLHFEGDGAPMEMPAPSFREAAQDFDSLMRDLGGASEAVAADEAVADTTTFDSTTFDSTTFDSTLSLDSSVDLPMDLPADLSFGTPAEPRFEAPVEATFDMPAVREFAPKEVLPSMDFDIAAPAAPTAKEVERAMPSFANLSLEALSDVPSSAATPRATDTPVAPQFNKNISDLEQKISSLSLVGSGDDANTVTAAANAARGAVLILAGIGGPDAVRQILTALPEGFSPAVLISQRLDGGRYDRLVQQMARAATLPVRLAEVGATLEAGIVYIVPPELGLDGTDGLRFAAGASLLDALPAEDAAVLLLSGADPASVDGALAHAARGALVAGQSPDGCYDAAAPMALTARGGTAGAPTELVQSLLQRWPA